MKNLSNVSLVCVEGLSGINVIEQAIKVIEHSSKVIRFGKKILITPKLEDNILSKLSDLGIIHYEINPLTWVGYNNFILLELVNYIDTDFCLTVQRDGFVLNPNFEKTVLLTKRQKLSQRCL